MGEHRLWAGSGMIVAAALIQTLEGASWSLVLLVLSSYAKRKVA